LAPSDPEKEIKAAEIKKMSKKTARI